MKIWIKTYANLGKIDSEVKVDDGITVEELINKIELSRDDVFLILVNGEKSKPGTVLKDGDSVNLFPSIGGG